MQQENIQLTNETALESLGRQPNEMSKHIFEIYALNYSLPLQLTTKCLQSSVQGLQKRCGTMIINQSLIILELNPAHNYKCNSIIKNLCNVKTQI